MAGVYGEIDSRVDYQRVLREAADSARRILARNPGNSTMQRIDKELDGMRRWTEDCPTDEQAANATDDDFFDEE